MKKQDKFILFSRDEFKNWLEITSFNRTIKLIQNHHTFLPNYSHFNGSNHFQKLKGMEGAHIRRGFGDIAQNITTFNDGIIAICRDFNKMPCGIYGANKCALSLEHLGNFNIGGDKMTKAHKDVIVYVNAILCKKFGLKPSDNSIVYHHWYDAKTGKRMDGSGSTKSCPGTNFFGGNSVEAMRKNFLPIVMSKYDELSFANKPQSIILTKGKVNINANDMLNVRSRPDYRAPLIRSLKNGTIVDIYSEKNKWYRISAKEEWANGRYIEKS